ncbi:MAG: DUF4198 domain-containing protein [Erythrobacter sp.]|jgi:hypothetical protein|nr:DUF4198 domain-containing protein [Erythrobacter sp.]
MLRTAIAALTLALATAAHAHSFWLEPADHTPEPGEEIIVGFKVGDVSDGARDVADWGLHWERIAALRLFGPDGTADMQRAVRTTAEGEPGSARIQAPPPGSYILAFASNPSFSDLEAERFDRYVAHEGLTAIAADRNARGDGANGTELYARRAKALLQIGDRMTPNVTRPIGQTLEIVPRQNPFALGEGAPLELQVLWRGEPLEGALVNAGALDGTGSPQGATTSADGIVTVPAPGEGSMLYSVVWGVPATNDGRADYFTIFASLTVGR